MADEHDDKDLLINFTKQFYYNMELVKNSGALSGEEHPGILAKVVLYLTGEQFRPLSSEGKELLLNLRHFI